MSKIDQNHLRPVPPPCPSAEFKSRAASYDKRNAEIEHKFPLMQVIQFQEENADSYKNRYK